MRLLLDTHAFLWLVTGSQSLSGTSQAALADPANDLYLSVASLWEMAIKTTSPKRQLELNASLDEFVAKWTTVYQLALLPVLPTHALFVARLPDFHRDPFDRLLIAQATVEDMTLVSGDGKFAAYSVSLLW